jgi:poly-gamma-glutamate synthesis protein (capsule biosynthesis protein)
MKGNSATILAVGDIILELPQGEFYLARVAPVLQTGDIVVGQGEIVFTSRGIDTFPEFFPSPGCPPSNIGALASAGFNVITLAGNHTWDRGSTGVQDSITGLKKHGIAVTGAGMNIDEARIPAIVERNGTKFGFLNYNCVGVRGQWATKGKPGCAYVHIITHYEMNGSDPGGPPEVYTFAEPRSLQAMEDDIKKLRPLCDILSVAFHMGILHSPDIAMYDRQISHAAVDAGADIVIGHHAHYLKGVEMYKGKPIYHGLGQFVPAAKGLTEAQSKEMRSLEGPKISSGYNHQKDPEQYRTIIAKCIIEGGKISQVGYIPCLINSQKQPDVLINDEQGQLAFNFMDKITKEAGLDTNYEWKGNEIVICK